MRRTSIHGLILTCACAAVGPVVSCKKPPPPVVITPLEHAVIFSGCAAVRRGPVCEVGEKKPVRVWLPDGELPEAFAVDGHAVVPKVEEGVAGGALYELTVAPSAGELSMAVKTTAGARAWRLKLAPETPLPPSVSEATRLQYSGDTDGAERILRDALAHATGDERCSALGRLGRLQASRERADEAIPLLKAAIDCDETAGRMSLAALESGVLAHVYVESWRFDEARSELVRCALLGRDSPESDAHRAYLEQTLAQATADARNVMRLSEAAENAFRRVKNVQGAQYALIIHARVLEQVGRPAEALALLSGQVDASAENPYDRSFRLTELGSLMLRSLELGVATTDPRPILEEAATLHHRLGNMEMEATALLYYARAALLEDDREGARAHVARAKQLAQHPRRELLLERLFVEGETDLASNDPTHALDAFRELSRLAKDLARPETAWLGAEGEGRALVRLGRRAEALRSFAQAEMQLSEASRVVPLGEGRDTYLGMRERSARERVAALYGVDPDAAFAAAREARARILTDAQTSARVGQLSPAERSLFEMKLGEFRRAREEFEKEVEQDWVLDGPALAKAKAIRAGKQIQLRAAYEAALSSLPSVPHRAATRPSDGELFLGYFPVPDGWVGFAATTARVLARHLGPIDAGAPAGALAARLLVPFQREIQSARRLVLLPYATLARIDFHALPFNARPLIATAPIEYALDLGVGSEAVGTGSDALVVADPRGDLPEARREGRSVARLLASLGAVRVLEGDSATRAALEAALPTVAVFHYSGHGAFAGHDGWDSALLLGGQSALSAADILSLPHIPATVILSGCETARAASEAPGTLGAPEGIGVAQALLVAGGHHVIATSRDIRDSDAQALVQRLYAAIGSGKDLAEALRSAQLEAMGSNTDWSAFRLLRR